MAKRSAKKTNKKKTYFPVSRIHNLKPLQNNQTTFMIRADKALCVTNHRLYRQSRVYSVKLNLDPNFDPNTTLEVYAIDPTWASMNAYKRAYETFVTNSKEERSSTDARWNDFRVEPGFDAADELFPHRKQLVSGNHVTIPDGEYLYSEVHDVGGNVKRFSWSGSSSSSLFNIIDEYDLHANTDASPSSPVNGVPYDGLEDELDAGQSDHLQNDGNNPPYALSTLDNDVLTKITTLAANPQAQRLSTGYFDAPCGFILIKASAPVPLSATTLTTVTLVCKEGDYKGVHAMSMLE